MKVKFNSEQAVGGKAYAKGVQQLPDRLAHTQEFKKLVQAGHVTVLPRSDAEQKMQAHKDAHAVKNAAQAFKAAGGPDEGDEA